MELADPRLIRQLTEAATSTPVRPHTPRPRKTRYEVEFSYQPRAHMKRRCKCNTCPTCLDNARWERIFNEKFADPTYYRDRAIRHDSPLQNL